MRHNWPFPCHEFELCQIKFITLNVLFKAEFIFWMKTFKLIIHPLMLEIDLLGKFCWLLWNIDIIFWLGSSSVSISKDGQTDQISSHVCIVSPLSICLGSRYQYLGLELIIIILLHHGSRLIIMCPADEILKVTWDPLIPAKTGIYFTLVFHVAILDEAYHLISHVCICFLLIILVFNDVHSNSNNLFTLWDKYFLIRGW